MHSSILGIWVSITLAGLVRAHASPFHPAMYCFNGTDPSTVNYNNDLTAQPLFQLTYDQYWMHHINNCDLFPPPPGVFLEIPAGQSIMLEIAANRAKTTYGLNGGDVSAWGDGEHHPDPYNVPTCIVQPNLHTQNESMAAGTAIGLAYKSKPSEVKLDDITIISVAYNTPYKRETTYHIPSGLPPCPKDGCICTFHWIPCHCGQSNMYMVPFQCQVIPDLNPPKTIGTPKAPVWCEEDQTKCVKGPKQPMVWNQAEGNNIEVEGFDLRGLGKSPAYNFRCGFDNGAQNDIFVDGNSSATGSDTLSSTSSYPTSSLLTGSGTPSSPPSYSTSSLPTESGTPSSPPSYPTSGLPTESGTPSSPPYSTSSLPAGSGTPSSPPSYSTSSLPTESGTPSSPPYSTSSLPTGSDTPSSPPSYSTSSLPTESSTPSPSYSTSSSPTGSGTPGGATCTPRDTASNHLKLMKMRRAAHNIF